MWSDVVALKQIIQLSGGTQQSRGPYDSTLIIGLVIVALCLAKVMLKEK